MLVDERRLVEVMLLEGVLSASEESVEEVELYKGVYE